MAARIAAVTRSHNVAGVKLQTVVLTDNTSHADSTTATGGSDWALVEGFSRHSIYVVNGASNSVVFTVEGSLDGTNFETISYRLLSSGVYAESNITITAGNKDVVHFSPTEYFRYLRVNVGTANANGTTFTLYSET